MKRKLIHLSIAMFLILFITSVNAQVNPNYGVWQAFGAASSNIYSDQVKGRLLSFDWSQIEGSKGQWVWTLGNTFDNQIKNRTKGTSSGSYGAVPVILSIFVYEVGKDNTSYVDAPTWLFTDNSLDIPKVSMTITPDVGASYSVAAPYYFSKDYQDRFKLMVEALRDHIADVANNSTDVDLKNAFQKVIGIQACYGSSGDFISYKGIPVYPTSSENYLCTVQKETGSPIANYDCRTALTSSDFLECFHIFSKIYQTAYYTAGEPQYGPQKIRVLHNPENEGSANNTWLLTNCPGTWRKCGSMGHIYQVADERSNLAWWKTTLSTPQYTSSTSDKYVRSRGEIVGGITDALWWQGSYPSNVCTTYTNVTRSGTAAFSGYPQKNLFTLYASQLYYGLDITNPEPGMLVDLKYDSAIQFFNRHAGQKDAASGLTGFCMLRDGLDASDKTRFNITDYGDYDEANPNTPTQKANRAVRAYNILNFGSNPLKNYGALLEDPCAMLGGEYDNRRANGINDVGYGIIADNYSRYITQIAPDIDGNGSPDPLYNTCNGYWNIKAIGDTGSVFGRFGKSIYSLNNSTDKAGMYFTVDDDYLSSYTGNLKITVHYLDKAALNWSFRYKPIGASTATIISISKGTTNKWKSVTFDVDASVFKNRNAGAYGSDFFLYATTTSATTPKETIFSLIEIAKAAAGSPAPVANTSTKSVYDAIIISPNPASERFTIKSKDQSGIKSVRIFNQFGRMVAQKKVYANSVTIWRTELGNVPGIYFIETINQKGEASRKELKLL